MKLLTLGFLPFVVSQLPYGVTPVDPVATAQLEAMDTSAVLASGNSDFTIGSDVVVAAGFQVGADEDEDEFKSGDEEDDVSFFAARGGAGLPPPRPVDVVVCPNVDPYKSWGGAGAYCLNQKHIYMCNYPGEYMPRVREQCMEGCEINPQGIMDTCKAQAAPPPLVPANRCRAILDCFQCVDFGCYWDPNSFGAGACVEREQCDYTYQTPQSVGTYGGGMQAPSTACIRSKNQCYVSPSPNAVLVPECSPKTTCNSCTNAPSCVWTGMVCHSAVTPISCSVWEGCANYPSQCPYPPYSSNPNNPYPNPNNPYPAYPLPAPYPNPSNPYPSPYPNPYVTSPYATSPYANPSPYNPYNPQPYNPFNPFNTPSYNPVAYFPEVFEVDPTLPPAVAAPLPVNPTSPPATTFMSEDILNDPYYNNNNVNSPQTSSHSYVNGYPVSSPYTSYWAPPSSSSSYQPSLNPYTAKPATYQAAYQPSPYYQEYYPYEAPSSLLLPYETPSNNPSFPPPGYSF